MFLSKTLRSGNGIMKIILVSYSTHVLNFKNWKYVCALNVKANLVILS